MPQSFPPNQISVESPSNTRKSGISYGYAHERSAEMLGNRGSGGFYLTSQQRTRSRNRMTSDCFFFWISSTYLRAPIWSNCVSAIEENGRSEIGGES